MCVVGNPDVHRVKGNGQKDKCVVTSGLKIMQHEDDFMKAMVGATHLPESVQMLVLKDHTVNLSNWNDVHVMTVGSTWEDACKKFAARVSSQCPGLAAVYIENPLGTRSKISIVRQT